MPQTTGNHRQSQRYDPSRTLISYVAELGLTRPDAPAILTSEGAETYHDMLARAESIAAYLSDQGVGPGDFVGIWARRSPAALHAMLGVLRAGAAYVPLDPGYASDVQLRQIVEQVPFGAILVDADPSDPALSILPVGCPRAMIGDISANEPVPGPEDWPVATGEDPACMVFTSGTTGTPKGVVLPNRGLASFGLDQDVIGVRSDDVVLHASSVACDGGLIEVWLAILNGAALALVEQSKPALDDIASTIRRHRVTVTSQYVGMQNLLVDHHADAFCDVRLTMAGGDVQSPDHIRRLKATCPNLRYVNIYGPSETTCISLVQEVEAGHLDGGPVPIGRPMTHESAFVVDEDLQPVSDGIWGQLAIGGEGVALGYFGLADRTAAVFIPDPRPGAEGTVYLTGDLALRRPDGTFDFGGRADRQIKLNGRRIELDGIEHVLRRCRGVQNAVVEVVQVPGGDRRIGAVVQADSQIGDVDAGFSQALLDAASRDLHREMLPKLVVPVPDIPVTKMGKPDREACRSLLTDTLREKRQREDAGPGTVRDRIAAIWQDMLGCGPIADDTTFFEAGGSSLRLFDAHAMMQKALGIDFEMTLLFETPQLGRLSETLAGRLSHVPARENPATRPDPVDLPRDTDIAIIGLAARLPGVDDLSQFWDAICQGTNLIERFAPEDLEDVVSEETRADPAYVPARSVLKGADLFDARHFNILPSEAERMDPQARVFLELCVHALEDAGVVPSREQDNIGVYAGSSLSTYLLNNVLGDRETTEAFTSGFQVDNYTTLTGNIPDTLATRIAYKLNLNGPAMSINAACATSLVVISQAVTALRAGQCDVALAGGVSITFPQKRGYMAQDGGMSSTDGLCRPFDADAQGTVFGHGAGVLVLKPLARALADGDRVDAVIRGVGLSNDGADKMSFTAPTVRGQAAAIRAAHADAGVAPETISYVECHGTATPLGDPIEIRALTQAFGPEGACALGSVKGNVGHLDAAAGVIGVIKTVQMLREAVIPPVANFRRPNPGIDFEAGPFFVPEGKRAWTGSGPRRAGVSAFGIGGTNAHVVLEEAPKCEVKPEQDGIQVLPLSAKSPEALAGAARDLADHLEGGQSGLADVAYTLQEGRQAYGFRHAVAADTVAQAVDRLRLVPLKSSATTEKPDIVFMFPGQGSQYPGMGRGLFADSPVFADWLNRGLDLMEPSLAAELRPLLTTAPDADRADQLRQTRLAQPALFLTQIACAQVWQSRGIRPAVLLGHSIGEFAAAVLAGVLRFEDALSLVIARGALMQEQPAGAMLSVRAEPEILRPYLEDPVGFAAHNAPRLQVVAGPEQAIETLAARLESDGILARRLATSHAFHSPMMAPAAEAFAGICADISWSRPDIPIISTLTGTERADFSKPDYWAEQMRAPVRFHDAVGALADRRSPVLLEVGVGNTLGTLAAQCLPREAGAVTIQSLPDHAGSVSDTESMAQALGALWCAGADVDWSVLPRGRRKLSLPGTHFIRKRHWIDAPQPVRSIASPMGQSDPAPFPKTEIAMTTPTAAPDRRHRLIADLSRLFCDISGEELSPEDASATFLELGFDSLFLGQAAQALHREYGITLSFRALLSDHPTLDALAAHLDTILPADPAPAPQLSAVEPAGPIAAPTPSMAADLPAAAVPGPPMVGDASVGAILQAQMQTMQAVFAEQLKAVSGAPAQASVPVVAPAAVPEPAVDATASVPKPTFKVGRAPSLAQADLTPAQLDFARDLARRYSEKFAGSKAHTQANRAHHADPRSAAGFRPEWKELTFPIVAARSKGACITDIDGNTLVDLVNGFGQTAFGHSPDFVSDALRAQIDSGYAIGPQSDSAGPVAEKFARLTGHERVTFCNTGSEAVMAAMRVARTVTGRETVVVFSNDYHGQFDEVLIKGKSRGEPGALPIAPGIPRAAVANMVVLEYGASQSLDWIRTHLDEIAAVVVEPVQSRHPELRPEAFLRSLRDLTATGGAALVMDEVVTGFRVHMRGMQGLWDIKADMATYGKVVGGGMPIGVLAGSARFMDALDGGAWRYGDDSSPQTAPTFFAGTFVRHPLVVAAVGAVLDHLETRGDALWTEAADRAAALSGRMNAALRARGLPDLVTGFSSWFVLNVSSHDPRATLLHALMRLEGVHTLDGFCGFLTTAHTDADCALIERAFVSAVDALQEVGILAPEQDVTPAKPGAVPAAAVPAAPAFAGPIPLTENQSEIWMTHQLGNLPAASFNESVSMRIEGAVDVAALNGALSDLVARHDALRLKFHSDGSRFDVQPPRAVHLEMHDFSAGADAESELARMLRDDAAMPFDLTSGMPIRFQLAHLGPDIHVLVVTAHHIVCDGWSFNTLVHDLSVLYGKRLGRVSDQLAAAPSFAAFAASGPSPMSPETRAFWAEQLAKPVLLPDLPTDRPRLAKKSYAGATTVAQFDAHLLKDVRKAGARHGCTLFATLFAAVQITLGRLSGGNDILLAVPTGGQSKLDTPDIVGHLVNLLPIRVPFEPGDLVETHLRRTSDAVMSAFDHDDTTLGTLVRSLEIDRSLERLPLTQIQFNLERLPEALDLGDARMTVRANPKAAVNFDLFFNMVETGDGLRAEVDFNTHLFDECTVQRWLDHLRQVLRELAQDTSRPISAIPLLSQPEVAELAAAFNPAPRAFPSASLIHQQIGNAVRANPDSIALTDEAGTVTYAELWAASGALAAHLQTVAAPSDRIGVAMPRDRSMLTALLAVLRAGMTYVPLDPAQPVARLRNVLQVAGARAVVAPLATHDELTGGLGPMAVDPAAAQPGEEPQQSGLSSDSPAYIIFTSGSTGTPKGVTISHRAVVNFLTSMAREPGFTSDDKILSVTTVSFDIAVLELFLPLVVGGQVEIASQSQILDGFDLARRLAERDITVMQATPTLWGMLVEAGFAPRRGLKMLAGGEPLPADLARTLSEGGELWNMYGPTETTIWSSVGRIGTDGAITIGAPVDNTVLHVLDGRDRLCPPGVVGELNIGGEGLANGYHERPDLTAAAFRSVTVAGERQRLYRTGDLAIRQADGSLTLLGRRDGQVKLRGYRIELGEIEARLRADASVANAAVALRPTASGTDGLVAYVVPAEGAEIDQGHLAARLSAELPGYMVPSAWVTLRDLPKTANGKLDRKALPNPQEQAPVRLLRAVEPPVGEVETQIAGIWCDVLGLDEISVMDTIFALGADSLTVFRIAARQIEAGLGLEARHVLEHCTIRALAAQVQTGTVATPARPSLRDFHRKPRTGT